jgi:hypothetical protein
MVEIPQSAELLQKFCDAHIEYPEFKKEMDKKLLEFSNRVNKPIEEILKYLNDPNGPWPEWMHIHNLDK